MQRMWCRFVTPALGRIAGNTMRRIYAATYGLDTRAVELLTAYLSVWFALVLVTSDAGYRPTPSWFWSGWCSAAAALKLLGVGASFDPVPPRWARWARLLGAGLGTAFWIVLTTVLFALLRSGISWGGYGIVAVAQGWVCWRQWRDSFRPARRRRGV